MKLTQPQANAVTSAVWLVGLAVLFATGWWWPGVLFVAGTGSLVQGLVLGRGWYALQGALWTFGVGVWALSGFNLPVLFVLLALSVLLTAFGRGTGLTRKQPVDPTLE